MIKLKIFLIYLSLTILFYTFAVDSNYCTPSSTYEMAFSNNEFEIITLTVLMKNNSLSMENNKSIKSDIAISNSTTAQKRFKILTIKKTGIF